MATTTTTAKSETTTFLVTIYIDPANVDEFLGGLRPCYEGCAQEPELLFFQVFKQQDDPGCFHLIEVWNGSREWFEKVQWKRAYYEPYMERTEHLWTKPRVITYVDPLPGWRTTTPAYIRSLEA